MARFNDDKELYCEACGDMIAPGDAYQKYNNGLADHICCNSADCMSNLLYSLLKDDFEECRLYTAEEYYDQWADLEGD